MMDEIFEKMTVQIQNAGNIIIMTHRYMDLDGFGAALGIYEIIKKYNKKSYIIINEEEMDTSIEKSIEKLYRRVHFNFIDKEKVFKYIDDKTLLIILDVHKREMLECPELLDDVEDIILLDHHIKGNCMIENIICSYLNTNFSSTVEIIVKYLEKENLKIESIVATIMLAGMYIDTNNFNIKTTSNTFLAAAYLMECGANNIIKQELFQENKKTVLRRQKLLKNSFMVNENVILCTLDKNIYVGSDLAKIAEELLQFEDVDASFVIGYVEQETVGVSARSLGKINVERIVKQLGGGGHKTDAAARLSNTSLTKAREMIVSILKGR